MSMPKLHDDPEDYFRLGRGTEIVFTRRAAKVLCFMLADRGFQLIGLDGGIHHPGIGFEARIEASWTRNVKANNKMEASLINLQAAESMDEDSDDYNGYTIVSIEI